MQGESFFRGHGVQMKLEKKQISQPPLNVGVSRGSVPTLVGLWCSGSGGAGHPDLSDSSTSSHVPQHELWS